MHNSRPIYCAFPQIPHTMRYTENHETVNVSFAGILVRNNMTKSEDALVLHALEIHKKTQYVVLFHVIRSQYMGLLYSNSISFSSFCYPFVTPLCYCYTNPE